LQSFYFSFRKNRPKHFFLFLSWIHCQCFSWIHSQFPSWILRVLNYFTPTIAGKTGKLVFSSLMKDERYYPIGLVRTEKSAKRLMKDVEHCGLENIWVCDVTSLNPDGPNGIPNGVSDAVAMIICTSAKPMIKKRSLVKAMLAMPINAIRGRKAFEFRSLEFYYKKGQHPEKVDYQGQIAQIDLAKKLGIPHVILVR